MTEEDRFIIGGGGRIDDDDDEDDIAEKDVAVDGIKLSDWRIVLGDVITVVKVELIGGGELGVVVSRGIWSVLPINTGDWGEGGAASYTYI